MVSIDTHNPAMFHARRNPAAEPPSPPRLAVLLALTVLSVAFWMVSRALLLSPPSASKKCLVSHGAFSGTVYSKNPGRETLKNECLVESPWLRLARHAVRISDGDGGWNLVDDWLFVDYHDRINVLVEAPRTATAGDAADGDGDGSPKFMVLEQTKYALSETSLAVVGGIIEPNEEASVAAQREVKEELSVTCTSWTALGRFRTDVNRGMGWVHPYLAGDCSYSNAGVGGDDANPDEVGGHDTEKQRLRFMSLEEVREAATEGKFVEVQWSNTVALAMLRLR